MRSRIFWPDILIDCAGLVCVGLAVGSASAGFLVALNFATRLRLSTPQLTNWLPVIGFCIGWVYHTYGQAAERGTDLILEEIHQPKADVSWRMGPLVLIGTILTHLCGGSAGREGTAVQIGGSLGHQIGTLFKLTGDRRRRLLIAGLSGGFGSVFGVPFAGAVFGVEVVRRGEFAPRVWLECLFTSWGAHLICLAWGVEHTVYALPEVPAPTLRLMLNLCVGALAFGLCARAFVVSSHALRATFRKAIVYAPFRPLVGGLFIVLGYLLLDGERFAGLGVGQIQAALKMPVGPVDFLGKFWFTILTLASGFKGGEVTPLLYIGATLGNSLAHVLALPLSLLAALGMVAVFAGAARTPLACAVMGMEIFGFQFGWYALLACAISYFCSGRQGIYVHPAGPAES